MQIWLCLRLDGEAVAALDGDEIGEVRPRDGELVGEDDADLRHGAVRLDVVREDAEAVLGDELVVGVADARRLRRARGWRDRRGWRASSLALGQPAAGKGQRDGAVRPGIGAEIAVDGRGGGVGRRLLAVGIGVGLAREAGAGEVEPGDGLVIGDGERRGRRRPRPRRSCRRAWRRRRRRAARRSWRRTAAKRSLSAPTSVRASSMKLDGRKSSSASRCCSIDGVRSMASTTRPATASGVAASTPKSDLRKHHFALVLKVKARQAVVGEAGGLAGGSDRRSSPCVRSKPE